jgi:SSS family transporter
MEALDWIVMAAYGALVLFIGWRVGRGHQNEEELFLGGRRIPAWAALCSMVATELSAATFIGVPHSGFRGPWFYLQFAFGSLLARIVLAKWFLSLYYRMKLVTVYGFLAQRFGRGAELCSSWFFLGGRLFASGTRLFIGALAFAVVTKLSVEGSIIVAGIIATIYTISGGIRAVIWTDTLQGAVFIIAAITALVALHGYVPGGLGEAFSVGGEMGKTKVFNLESLDFLGHLSSGTTLLAALFGGFFLTMATHGTDQDMVQRLLTTKSSRRGGSALILSGVANFPLTILFLTLGLGLWWFYLGWTGPYSIEDHERIFPLFVFNEIPAGLRGLIFAGLFAAAMSSMDSSLNSMATTWVVDIRGNRGTQKSKVIETRLSTLIFGVLEIGAAILAYKWYESTKDQPGALNLVELALSSMTILYGGLLGAFLVGLLTPDRGTNESVVIGMLVSGAVGLALVLQPVLFGQQYIAWPWWIVLGTLVSFAIGASVKSKKNQGITHGHT